jgi:WD40 repeat protein
MADGEPLSTLERPDDVNALAFAPDDTLAIADEGGMLSLIQRSGHLRHEHDLGALSNRGRVFTVSFSPDGRIVAGGGLGRIVALFDVETGAQLRVLRYYPTSLGNSSIECSQFSPDGRWFAVGSYNGNVYMHDVADDFRERRVIARGGAVRTVAFSPNSARIAIGSWDHRVAIYDVATGTLCRRRESSRPN